jgi:hypothetical protein
MQSPSVRGTVPATVMKVCKDCGQDETTVVFPKHRLVCRECANKRHKTCPSAQREIRAPYLRDWRTKNPLKQREYDLRYNYNATSEQVAAILAWNGGPCFACGKLLFKFGTGVDEACIDHDHDTEIVRGIICGACNRALGLVKDSIEHLKHLEAYLQGERLFLYWASILKPQG